MDRDRLRKEVCWTKNESSKQRNEELTSDMENYFCEMQTVKVSRSDAVVCRGLF